MEETRGAFKLHVLSVNIDVGLSQTTIHLSLSISIWSTLPRKFGVVERALAHHR